MYSTVININDPRLELYFNEQENSFYYSYFPVHNTSSQKFFQHKRVHFFQKVYTLASIELESLKTSGIQGMILDLDNTIVSEDDRYISPGAEAWIEQAKTQGFIFFILSNGKRHKRAKYWSRRLDIPLINPANKPLPFAFCKALSYMRLQPKQVVVVGDSRHTDILGAWLTGCHSIQVATLPHPFRWWEKLLGKRVQTPYPYGHTICDTTSSKLHTFYYK